MLRDNLENNEKVKANTAFENELREKLPNFFNDKGFDLDKFQDALKEKNVKEFSEGYQLNFIGKDYARKQAGDAPTTVIVPDNEHNQKEENKNSQNLFFTGDNLEVLRHLRNNYSNKIDVIYIDPPYNTGNDDFVYPDKFEYTNEQLEEIFGLTENDIRKLQNLKKSKSHSSWLTFMYSRLRLAKYLLKNNGKILISIDDNEQSNLKLIMDEIFGDSNFIATLPTIMNLKGNQDQYGFAGTHEYTLVYAKNKNKAEIGYFKLDEEDINKEWKKDEYGYYKKGANLKASGKDALRSNRPNLYFPIFTKGMKWSLDEFDEAEAIYPITGGKDGRWRWSKSKFQSEAHNVIISRRGKSVSFYKKQRPTIGNLPTKKPKSYFYKPEYSSGSGTEQIKKIFGDTIFENPKSVDLIKDFFEISTEKDSLILDFFAGSATTADAVMQLNAEDGGHRKFIMVQLPEKLYKIDENGNKKAINKGSKAAFSAGYMSIDEISRERIKRAAQKIKDENHNLDESFDGGFKHYHVVSPQKATLDKIFEFDPNEYELVSDMVDSFSSEKLGIPGNARGEDTILTTWLAQDGYDFDFNKLTLYDFNGYKAYGIKDNRLYLINGNWNSDCTKMLLNQLGNGKIRFQSIVIYGYSFNIIDLKELELGISQLNSKVNLIKRY